MILIKSSKNALVSKVSHRNIKQKHKEMYIIAFDFFEKGDKYIFKANSLYCLKEIFGLFLKTNKIINIIYICTTEILKPVLRYTISICICVGR